MIFLMDRKIDAIVIKKIILLYSCSCLIGSKSSRVGSRKTLDTETLELLLVEAFDRNGFGFIVKWNHEIERKFKSETRFLMMIVAGHIDGLCSEHAMGRTDCAQRTAAAAQRQLLENNNCSSRSRRATHFFGFRSKLKAPLSVNACRHLMKK